MGRRGIRVSRRRAGPLRGGVVLVVGLLLGLLTEGSTRGESARRTITPIAAAAVPAPLDLAAMTLVPSDVVEEEGPGFALAGAGPVGLAAAAERIARSRGETRVAAVAAVGEALSAAGWRRRYESRLAAPEEEDTDRFAAVVHSAVTEFATAEGATAAFAQTASVEAAATGRDVRGMIPLGDESRLTRTFVPAPGGGPPVRRLALTFRLGQLLAAVTIVDYTGEREWGIAAVEGLAARLLVRIEAVRSGVAAGLEPRLLRIAAAGAPPPVFDVYDRRAGETLPLYGVDPEDAADREQLYGAATDVYTYETFVTSGKVGGTAPYYAVKLYRFPDPAAAAAWLHETPEILFDDPGSFLDLAEVEAAATIGEESRTISYGFPVSATASETVVTRGYRVYARVGPEVARVQMDAAPEVPLAVVEAVARAQVTCLAAAVCAESATIPAGSPVSATPVPAP